MGDLASIVKAYDIRGVVPDQLDEPTAEAIGAAFAKVTGAARILTVHDMRASSAPLAAAFGRGAASQGADVLAAGLGSTDMLYFGSGDLGIPGAMVTASHNPPQYNGIKLCRAGAKPVGIETGLKDIQDLAERTLPPAPVPGSITTVDLLPRYAEYVRKLVDISEIRPLTVAVDAGNGMAGHTVPKVFEGLPITLIPLYFELDGTFPNHEANPIEPENLRDLQRAVVEHHADGGLAFDGDADRCFVVDERGQVVSPSALTALIAARELAREPGAAVIHNLITSRAVPEIIAEHGGVPVRTRVGHSFIKAKMAERNAVFGGEHSGHFYFRDFWFADSGMLAALHTLAALGGQAKPLSQLMADYSRYHASGEINSQVADQAGATAWVKQAFESRPGVRTDELDGLTVSAADWWFNLRPSNTEPLLRLNVEADSETAMAALRDEVLAMVRPAAAGGQSSRAAAGGQSSRAAAGGQASKDT
ncbi:MAG TPA: phosphomannomutase/phosphoglucomutase [Streptosporangiaceae bacterium]|nr:phosphomannomutase/phosphoglucomutase [Streptosporangiaceae bacterium]